MIPVYNVIFNSILCVFIIRAASTLNIKNDSHVRSNLDRIRRQAERCSLPLPIENGNWSIFGNANHNFRPGDLVESGTILEIKCDNGNKVSNYPICGTDGNWINDIPKCTDLRCDALISTSTTFVTCALRKNEVDCGQPVAEGAYAKFSCDSFHELSTTHDTMHCSRGKWEGTEPKCTPVCGENSIIHKKLIVKGEDTKPINYPWTIALYRLSRQSEYSFKCSGTLINERVIVTAAHCVSNINGRAHPENLYMVAAGKYYRNYSHPNDTDAEFSEIEKIVVHNKYRGSTFQYEYDIAVLVTKNSFNTTDYIRRICVEWDQFSYNEAHLLGANGTITGWGNRVSGKNLSETLQKVSLPYVDFTTCFTRMPEKFQMYIRNDKMCAGYIDKGIAVCEGDSGGGYIFPNPRDKNRYYLRGVVSSSAQIFGSCDENKYSLHTRVADYIDFIATYEKRYQGVPATSLISRIGQVVPVLRCVLPLQIKNGKWNVGQNNTEYRPGDRVAPGTMLVITCDEGYDVPSDNTKIHFCNSDGNWLPDIPKCITVPLCRHLKSTATTIVTCFSQGKTVNCSTAFTGTYATYECAEFYELAGRNNVLFCSGGKWDNTTPKCTAVCGESPVPTKELIIKGDKFKIANYPWSIAIYKFKGYRQEHVCGGTLINQRLIVTAAHCVSTTDGIPFSATTFRVAAGKFFRAYIEPTDVEAKYSDIEEIHVHDKYRGQRSNFEYDIAVLVTRESFEATRYIQRVCVDWKSPILFPEDQLLGATGTVTGWGFKVGTHEPSEVVKEVTLPYVDYETCSNALPDYLKNALSKDKICAGNSERGIGVCDGDSGGGLVFKNPKDKGRFYLKGVLVNSVPHSRETCGESKFAISTRISVYTEFVRSIQQKFPD